MQMFSLEFYEAIARIADKVQFEELKRNNESTTNLTSQKDGKRSRKNTQGLEIEPPSNLIKIEGDFDVLQSSSKSSSSSEGDNLNENLNPLEDDIMVARASTKVKPLDFKVLFNANADNQEDNSAYSLGDGEKLYQKLEEFIQVLIKNCFKKKMKKLSNKMNNQTIRKTNLLQIDNESGEIANPSTPTKHLTSPKYDFKRAFTRKIPVKNTTTSLDYLKS